MGKSDAVIICLIILSAAAVKGIKVSSNCSQPLGMEDGRIADSQISASSSYQIDIVGPDKECQIYNSKNSF